MSPEFRYKTQLHRLDKLRLNYVEIPWDALTFFPREETISPFNQRFLISVNDSPFWHGGVVSLGNQTGYITVKTEILKKKGLQLGDWVEVCLQEDHSEFGMEVAEELEEVWNQMPETKVRFLETKPSMQRYIIFYVNQVKSKDKRIERSLKLMQKLLLFSVGKENFKDLIS